MPLVDPKLLDKLHQRAAIHERMYGCSRGRSLFVAGCVIAVYILLCRFKRPSQQCPTY